MTPDLWAPVIDAAVKSGASFDEFTNLARKYYLEATLKQHDGNISQTSRDIKKHRNGVSYWLVKFRIRRGATQRHIPRRKFRS